MIEPLWTLTAFKRHPVRMATIIIHLLLRILFGIFWLAAGINKISKQWLTTDTLEQVFIQRLTELPPDTFAVLYLQALAIPYYLPLAWLVTLGELYVAAGLLLGFSTRWAAGLGFFILLNFAMGGYYDASLIPFLLLAVLFFSYPSGQWFGLDRRLCQRYPNSIWFK